MCIDRQKHNNQILMSKLIYYNRKKPIITQHMRNYWHVWTMDSIRATIRHIIFSVQMCIHSKWHPIFFYNLKSNCLRNLHVRHSDYF
jgi:hypothetical protein